MDAASKDSGVFHYLEGNEGRMSYFCEKCPSEGGLA